MGWPKYYEDNVRICDERHYDHDQIILSEGRFDCNCTNGESHSQITHKTSSPFRCPICKLFFETELQLSQHITSIHATYPAFFMVNGSILTDETCDYESITSLSALYFGLKSVAASVSFENNIIASARLDGHNRIVDLTSIIGKNIVNRLTLTFESEEASAKFLISQKINILEITEECIQKGYYKPEYFISDVKSGQYSLEEYRVFLSLLAYSGDRDSAEMLREIIRVDPTKDNNEVIIDYFLFESLYIGNWAAKEIDDYCSISDKYAFSALYHIMNLEFSDAYRELKKAGQNKTDFQYGCQLILAYLTDDVASINYFEKIYSGFGILAKIILIVKGFRALNFNEYPNTFSRTIFALKPLNKFRLMQAINNLAAAIYEGESLNFELMDSAFNRISPICSVIRAEQADPVIKEKILLSALKRFKSCEWLLDYIAANQSYSWINQRVTPVMSKRYHQAVEEANSKLDTPFTDHFLSSIDYKSDLTLTSLSRQDNSVGSCFLLSCNGYNIMLDCGIDPGVRDESALPNFDLFRGTIDAILITHAHADHSGAIVFAHARWPNAPIFTSPETKTLLEPLLVDMAQANQTDFESENDSVSIDYVLALETYRCILTINFSEWVHLSNSVKFRLHRAGHILGAGMIEIQLAEKNVVYTGDFCFHSQELVAGAKVIDLPTKPDLLICEATYMLSGLERNWYEQRMSLKRAIQRECRIGNVVILPTAAMGRAQELLCIIGDMILEGTLNNDIQIFIGGFAKKTCASLIDITNAHYRQLLERTKQLDKETIYSPGSIIIASSGSMRKNSASYRATKEIAQYTNLGFRILASTAIISSNPSLRLEKNVEYQPLSTHADKKELESFITQLSPKSLALVHWGTSRDEEKFNILSNFRKQANGDLITIKLNQGNPVRIFELKSWIETESAHYEAK